MARVKVMDIVDHLNMQFRGALDEAIARTLPDSQVDRAQLYREFRRALGTKTKQWEQVPNSAVDAE